MRLVMFTASIVLTAFTIILVICLNPSKASAESDTEGKIKCYQSIEINSGDTLWSIADQYAPAYGCSSKDYVNEIMRLNGLHSDLIKTGNKILIVYWNEI